MGLFSSNYKRLHNLTQVKMQEKVSDILSSISNSAITPKVNRLSCLNLGILTLLLIKNVNKTPEELQDLNKKEGVSKDQYINKLRKLRRQLEILNKELKTVYQDLEDLASGILSEKNIRIFMSHSVLFTIKLKSIYCCRGQSRPELS